jgi:hypothetical protein
MSSTSSYVLLHPPTHSHPPTSSYTLTSSYILLTLTSSYILLTLTSSYILLTLTSSYIFLSSLGSHKLAVNPIAAEFVARGRLNLEGHTGFLDAGHGEK